MILYDRSDHALWSQILGEAISGPHSGVRLRILPVSIETFEEFGRAHPEGLVVDVDDTGMTRPYQQSAYDAYRADPDLLWFDVKGRGTALGPKTLGLGISAGDEAIFVPASAVRGGEAVVPTSRGPVRVDGSGAGLRAVEVPADVLVTVQDTTPPQVMCTSDVAMLWPPNHERRTVTLYVMGTDAVSDSQGITPLLVTLRSDERDDAVGTGDGETTGDVNGADGFFAPVEVTSQFVFQAGVGASGAWLATVQLRAERAGEGDGRCYTIDVTARDTSGNEANTSCCIVVPHDRRR